MSWFPASVRRGMTDFLRFMASRFRVYDTVIPVLVRGLRKSKDATIVDLCSGSGGPLLAMHAGIEAQYHGPVTVILSDRFPPAKSCAPVTSTGQGPVSWRYSHVDAADAQFGEPCMRTLFSSFHHFRPAQARAILRDAADNRQPVLVVEATERSLAALACMVFIGVVVLVLTPMSRPFRWSTFIWTYLVPAIPVCITWDALVSVLRSYSVSELIQLGREAAPEYRWEAARIALKGSARILYLLGTPQD